MPYKDAEQQKAAKAKWYRERYAASAAFRKSQAASKKRWGSTPEGREKHREWCRQQRRAAKPNRAFVRFNLDNPADVAGYLDFTAKLDAKKIKRVERTHNGWITVSATKAGLIRAGLLKKS